MIITDEFQDFSPFIEYSEYVFRLHHPLTFERNDLGLPQPYPNKVYDVITRARRIPGALSITVRTLLNKNIK